MQPNQPLTAQQKKDQADEQECGKRIDYILKKYGCALDGTAIINTGATQVLIGVKKIPADVLKQMKAAEKGGLAAPAA